MHTIFINYLILLYCPISFEHSSVHPEEDLYMQFYGISVMRPYQQSGRWQDVFDTLV